MRSAAGAGRVIADLVPPGVVAEEEYGDPADYPLFAHEQDAVRRAVPARRREFASARRCARRALALLGIAPVAIPVGAEREPRWPADVVGSITHCTGYRAAAVAPVTAAASIGIDAEPHEPLPDGVSDAVTVAADRAELARLAGIDPSVHWDKLLFSAKESVYKAWYPLTGRWLGFEDASLTFDVPTATFTARLLVPGPRLDGAPPLSTFSGRWSVGRGLMATLIVVPPHGGGGSPSGKPAHR